MPQQTNLNVAPYFDDFDPTNDYHKVLFKPGYPVQARELSTLQSILQNQIERFGQHFFKEGAKVIPGNTGYSQLYYAVQLANTYQGVPVEAYVEQLIGSTITGQTSGVTATVDSVLFSADSERDNLTCMWHTKVLLQEIMQHRRSLMENHLFPTKRFLLDFLETQLLIQELHLHAQFHQVLRQLVLYSR